MNCAYISFNLGVPPSFSLYISPNTITSGAALDGISSGTLSGTNAAVSDNSHDNGDTGNPTDLEVLIQTPLQLGKTLIIYYPHIRHPPEIVNTAILSYMHEPQPSLSHPEPWAPFASYHDFKQAELFSQTQLYQPVDQ